jgi:transposase
VLIDLHKRTHTVVAVDDNGRWLAERTVGATPAGHLELLSWAKERFAERRWALEDCRHLSGAWSAISSSPARPWSGCPRS